MANLRGYMSGGKEWVLDSGCTDHMTRYKDMFPELAEMIVLESMSLSVTTQKVRWLASVRWPYHMIAPYKMLRSLNLLDTTYFQYLDLLTLVSVSYLLKLIAKCFVETIIKWSLPVYIEVIFTLLISLKRPNLKLASLLNPQKVGYGIDD